MKSPWRQLADSLFDDGGIDTPGVVRYPLERLAAQHLGARFVPINREYPSLPAALTDRAIGIASDGGDVLGAIWKLSSGRSRTSEA